ncbi:hypothetical protein Dsin_000584 [Dipteronia sinensis]|uniref:CCHC-type domain-containing protein n=1 Tax=Dipteronia sinensis TaxID=43782 RepID=A0AAE0B2B3_9ROSI|nr:hypothetical protein Dsin_000584 [Dipteronia sinensis]
MAEEIGSFLGNNIGEVHDMDIGAVADGSSRFLRVRVTVTIDKPLQRCLLFDLLGNEKITTMLLRYKRLMDYCFRCNRFGHVMDECVMDICMEDGMGQVASTAKEGYGEVEINSSLITLVPNDGMAKPKDMCKEMSQSSGPLVGSMRKQNLIRWILQSHAKRTA